MGPFQHLLQHNDQFYKQIGTNTISNLIYMQNNKQNMWVSVKPANDSKVRLILFFSLQKSCVFFSVSFFL